MSHRDGIIWKLNFIYYTVAKFFYTLPRKILLCPINWGGGGTVLPNGVKGAVSDWSQKCQKLTKVGLACSLQLY